MSAVVTLGAAYLGYRLALSKDRQVRQDEIDRHARYAAIRAVCELDRFVSACCGVVYDTGEPDASGCMEPSVDYPELTLPDDIDWKCIQSDLMYRTVSLPSEIASAKSWVIGSTIETAGPPDYTEFFEERSIQFGRLGLKALSLADCYRGVYEIPARTFLGESPQALLEEKVALFEKQKAERETWNKFIFADEINNIQSTDGS